MTTDGRKRLPSIMATYSVASAAVPRPAGLMELCKALVPPNAVKCSMNPKPRTITFLYITPTADVFELRFMVSLT